MRIVKLVCSCGYEPGFAIMAVIHKLRHKDHTIQELDDVDSRYYKLLNSS